MTRFEFSEEQIIMNETIKNPNSNSCIFNAPAGNGKTNVIIQTIKESSYLRTKRIVIVVFNNKLKQEITKLCEKNGLTNVNVRTFHSLGMEVLKFNGIKLNLNFENVKANLNYKYYKAVKAEFKKDIYDTFKGNGQSIFINKSVEIIEILQKELANLENENECFELVESYADINGGYSLPQFELALKVLKAERYNLKNTVKLKNGKSFEAKNKLSWMDCIYYPVMKDIKMKYPYDLAFIDEYQDQNLAFLSLINQNAKKCFYFGDERQAINGWNGANIEKIKTFLNEKHDTIETIDLNTTFRYGKNISDYINHFCNTKVESIKLNNDGKVFNNVNLVDFARKNYKYNSAILCYKNSTAMEIYKELIKFDIPLKITGNNVGQYLSEKIKDTEYTNIISLLDGTIEEKENFVKTQMKYGFNMKLIEEMTEFNNLDNLIQLLNLLNEKGLTTLDHLKAYINEYINIDEDKPYLTISTVNKAKGLTYNNVAIYDVNEFTVNEEKIKESEKDENKAKLKVLKAKQDMKNLIYVGFTRCTNSLTVNLTNEN